MVQNSSAIRNFLSIDVEDYFQVSAFESISPPATWDSRELRVEHNTDKILNLLAQNKTKATFFILGWVANRCPDLVKRVAREGHEVASHGYGHRRVNLQSRNEFREDVRRSKALLEDLCGQPVLGYRAPSYSIGLTTLWAYDELLAAGYAYDSSVFPVPHDLYGISHWPRFPFYVVRDGRGNWSPHHDMDEPHTPQAGHWMQEIPITTLHLGGRNLPIAGGGYFRLYPYALTRWGLRHINRKEQRPFVFYLHPWELDPQQPRMVGARGKSRLRHYLNLDKTESRFHRLLADFAFSSIRESLQVPSSSGRGEIVNVVELPAQGRTGHAHTPG